MEAGHWHLPFERCPADLNGDGQCFFFPHPHPEIKGVDKYGLITDGCPLTRITLEMQSAMEAGRRHAIDPRSFNLDESSGNMVDLVLTASAHMQQQAMAASMAKAMAGIGKAVSDGSPKGHT